MSSSPRVAVVGGNGVYARHLLPRLVRAGYPVRAVVRRPEAATVARACGAEVRVADLFDEEALCAALDGCAIGINVATSLPGPSGRGDFQKNDELRRTGTPIWMRACARAGVGRVVQQSIAMVNACGETWADEDSAPTANEGRAGRAIEAALDMERTVRDAGLDHLILRGGLFYGPGTGFDDDWFARARAGTLRLPGDGSQFVSLVHIADMAAATVVALDTWPTTRTLIIADDRPATWREVLTYVTAVAGAAEPAAGGQLGLPSFRVRNTRARAALAWTPRYPDFASGLVR